MARNYETVYVMNPALGEEGFAVTSERIHTLIESNGTLGDVETWGLRKLAYEIDKIKEGYYVLVRFSTDDMEFPKELERVFKLTEGILRFLVIRTDEA